MIPEVQHCYLAEQLDTLQGLVGEVVDVHGQRARACVLRARARGVGLLLLFGVLFLLFGILFGRCS